MNFELLAALCETPGIPGREEQIRARVIEAIRPLTDDVRVDVMGNVIGRRRGRGGPRIMVVAHMDEIGFLVRHIEDRGFLRVHPVGGWDARAMFAQRVWVHGHKGDRLLGALMPAIKPIHLLTEEERNKAPKIEQFFVDLGLPEEEVRARVEVGDMVTMARRTDRAGDMVMSKALDDRLMLFLMLEALRQLDDHESEIFAVASTQEEVGLRGALTAAYAVEPEIGVALDITLANDLPTLKSHEYVTRVGEGPAIKIMDSSVISHHGLVRHFREIADAEGIPYQLEILPRGGTDAGAMQRSRAGVPSITLSVPVRYVHTVNEMAAIADIENGTRLLARFLERAQHGRYGFESER